MKKRIIMVLALLVAISLCFSLIGCSAFQGKSAYEIACDNGFTGTEQEWLASLTGKSGTDGKDAAIDIYDLFEAYLDIYPDADFEEFLNSFLMADYYDTQYAASKALLSIVRIRSKFTIRTGGYRPTTSTTYAEGSGVVYRIEGGKAYIITNYHMIYDYDSTAADKTAEEILVYTYGTLMPVYGEFVGGSIDKDVAVVKVTASELPDFVKTAVLADSNTVTPGIRSIAVGNPLAEGISVTAGIVSVDSEEIQMEALNSTSATVTMRVIRTDASINSGNSGGGLFNMRGELIGIVNAKTVSSGVENMGYAIPVNVAVGIADCVIDNNSKKCALGIYVNISAAAVSYSSATNKLEISETVGVESVSSGALAEGKLLAGDILLSVKINEGNWSPITRTFYLSDYLYKVRAGDTIYLNIERNGTETTVQLTVNSNLFVNV